MKIKLAWLIILLTVAMILGACNTVEDDDAVSASTTTTTGTSDTATTTDVEIEDEDSFNAFQDIEQPDSAILRMNSGQYAANNAVTFGENEVYIILPDDAEVATSDLKDELFEGVSYYLTSDGEVVGLTTVTQQDLTTADLDSYTTTQLQQLSAHPLISSVALEFYNHQVKTDYNVIHTGFRITTTEEMTAVAFNNIMIENSISTSELEGSFSLMAEKDGAQTGTIFELEIATRFEALDLPEDEVKSRTVAQTDNVVMGTYTTSAVKLEATAYSSVFDFVQYNNNVLDVSEQAVLAKDLFVFENVKSHDVLLVVDNSPSMADEQQILRESTEVLFELLGKSGLDFKIAVITTDSTSCITSQNNSDCFINDRDEFLSRQPSDTGGSTDESGIFQAEQALGPNGSITLARIAQGRQDNDLSVLIISDERDSYTSYTGGTEFNFDDNIFTQNGYKVDAIVPYELGSEDGLEPTVGCNVDSEGGVKGTGSEDYAKLVLASGGIYTSLCQDNYESFLKKVARRILGEYFLSRVPVSVSDMHVYQATSSADTDQVPTDGQSANGWELQTMDEDNGWSYESQNNSIYFSGSSIPETSDQIAVVYKFKSIVFQSEYNFQCYMYVENPSIDWSEALLAASGTTFNGISGYLAKIGDNNSDSKTEKEYITETVGGKGWAIKGTTVPNEGLSEYDYLDENGNWLTMDADGDTVNARVPGYIVEFDCPAPGGISGTVTGVNGNLEGASVSITLDNGAGQDIYYDSDDYSTLTTNSNGLYFIDKHLPGESTVSVKVQHPDYLTQSVVVTISAGATVEQNIQLEIGSGTVNGNVVDQSGSPLSGVTINIKEGSTQVAIGTTGADGTFSVIVEASENKYSATFSKEGYTNVTSEEFDINNNSSYTISDLELTEMVGTVTGKVVNEDGEVLSGVTVTALQNQQSVESTTTGADGTFSLELSSAETVNDSEIYTLSFTLAEYRDQTVDNVEVVIQTTTELDTDVLMNLKTGTLAGTITDDEPEQNAVSGVTIAAYIDDEGDGIDDGDLIGSTTSGADGTFSLTLPSDKTYTVVYSHNSYVSQQVEDVLINLDETTNGGTQITPKVVYGNLTGTVLDENGDPLVGAQVVIRNNDGQVIATGLTGADGTFDIEVETGTHTVEISLDNYVTLTFDGVNSQTINRNETTSMNQITMQLSLGTLTGTITDVTNPSSPVVEEGVKVLVKNSDGEYLGETTSDANGQYSMEVLTGENYVVSFSKTDFAPVEQGSVTINLGQETELNADITNLTPSGTLSGTITDLDGTPLANATIQAIGTTNGSTSTNASGNYSLTLDAGTYTVNIVKDGYETVPNSNVVIVYEEETELNANMELSTGTISGTVTGELGEALQSVVVSALEGVNVVKSVQTDAAGNYELVLDPATYTVKFVKTDYVVSTSDAIALVANGAETWNQQLTEVIKFTDVSGAVRDENDAALSGVNITAVNQTTNATLTTSTDANGQYELELENENSYFIQFSKSKYQVNTQNVTLAEEEVLALDVVLSPIVVQAYGTVTEKDLGTKLQNVTVSINDGEGHTNSGTTDANGAYSVDASRTYVYDITYSKSGYVSVTLNDQDANVFRNNKLDVQLEPETGVLSGVVRNSEDGTTVSEVVVSIKSTSYEYEHYIEKDDNGAFSLTIPTRETYTVTFNKTQYFEATKTNVSVPGSLDISMVPNYPKGDLTGKVVDDRTGSNIKGATVELYYEEDDQETLLQTTTTNNYGSFGFNNIRARSGYNLKVSKSEYVDKPIENITVPEGGNKYVTVRMQAIITIEPVNIYGIVIDGSRQGTNPLSGATVTLYEGAISDPLGRELGTRTTNSSGSFNFGTYDEGTYTFQVSRSGYITRVIQETIESSRQLQLSIVPSQGNNTYTIVLDWDLHPYDLDAHLVLPNGQKVYWQKLRRDNANLDRDDVDGDGPETMTIVNPSDNGTYKFCVHNYSQWAYKGGSRGYRYREDVGFDESGATVTLSRGSDNLKVFTAPFEGEDYTWKVFNLVFTNSVLAIESVNQTNRTNYSKACLQ